MSSLRSISIPTKIYLDVYADRLIDLNFLIVRLHLADCPSFAASMKSFRNRERALWGCVLRGVALQSDFLDWLDHPIARARAAADWRDHGLDGVNAFSGIDRNLDGLSGRLATPPDPFSHPVSTPPLAPPFKPLVMPSWPPYSGDNRHCATASGGFRKSSPSTAAPQRALSYSNSHARLCPSRKAPRLRCSSIAPCRAAASSRSIALLSAISNARHFSSMACT